MATVTALKAKPKAKSRRDLAEELLGIEIANAELFGRIDGIKSDLKGIATSGGESFKEEFAGQGSVTVAGVKGKRFLGEAPELDPDAWLALPEKRREAMLANGLVKMVRNYSGAYYGAVTVKLF